MKFESIWHKFINTGFFDDPDDGPHHNDDEPSSIRQFLKEGTVDTSPEGKRVNRHGMTIDEDDYGEITSRSLDLTNP